MSAPPDSPPATDDNSADKAAASDLSLYHQFLDVREDILRHKWLRSEEAGEDIGFEAALLSWAETLKQEQS